MRLNHFLNEGRTETIDDDKALEFLSNRCQDSIHQNWKMYRGMSGINSNKFYYVNPINFTRKSANAVDNYYTLLIDNLPEWKDYPKRAKSIVCASNRSQADGYGIPCRVFPVDNANVGVCPTVDLWFSFEKYGIDILSTFNAMFHGLIVNVLKKPVPNTWAELKKIFEYIDINKEAIRNQFMELNLVFMYKYFSQKIRYFNGDDSLLDVLQYQFHPEKNGFKHVKVGQSGVTDMVELWTDAECIIIPDTPRISKLFWEKIGVVL